MDIKIKIKEEDLLSDNTASQNERQFFLKDVTMRTNKDAVLQENDCDVAIKTEFKSETPFPYCCSRMERERLAEHTLKKINFEAVSCSSNCDLDMKTECEEQILASDFSSHNREFLHEKSQIEVKVEPVWLQAETASLCDDIKFKDLLPVKSSRLCTTDVSVEGSGKSPFPSDEVLGRHSSFYNGNDCLEYESKESEITEIPTAEDHSQSEQPGKLSDVEEMYSRTLCLNQRNLINKGERSHKCIICGKKFTHFSDLKKHNWIHEGKRPYQCKTCDKKSFTRLSDLKRHNLIHDGMKPYQCKTCNKSFTRSSHLKTHNLIHEGKKPHECKNCGKSFTQMSHLKTHNLIHEGKKSHQCKTCNKNFTHFSSLKRHNLIHQNH